MRDCHVARACAERQRSAPRTDISVVKVRRCQINNPLISAIAGIALLFAGYFLRKYLAEQKIGRAEKKSRQILKETHSQADSIRKEAHLEAKELLLKLRTDFEAETKERRKELHSSERRLNQRERNLDRKVDILEKQEALLSTRTREIAKNEEEGKRRKEELTALIEEEKRSLERAAGLSREQAKQALFARFTEEVRRESANLVSRIIEEAKETGEKKAREIITSAIQRCSADQVVESSVSVVSLPDEMKGRVIGREGRNIRAFEAATGVDLIVDDTPEAVTLSSFNIYRREVAKIALEKLIADGRIHPGRIEEIVEKSEKGMEKTIDEVGKQTIFELGITMVHPEMVRLLGRLKYRTSYGQNVLVHSREVAYLAALMAAELKLDERLAKRAGLLHDIGKAVDIEQEGTHPQIGAKVASRYNESPVIINAIAGHHGDVEATNPITPLIAAADSISATRPGARRETLEGYIKRLEKLENIAASFKGVSQAYAISAGREIRVIVKPEEISDSEATVLTRDITKKIEEGLEYPGQVKVTVIREVRTVDYAK